MTSIVQRIKSQREAKRLSQNRLADVLGLSIHEYWDIEVHEDELSSMVPLSKVKDLCRLLDLDLLDLMGISCVFCAGDVDDVRWRLPRHTLCRKIREDAKMSMTDVADAIGYYVVAIAEYEDREDALESWCVDEIMRIAETLRIPLQLLLGVHCSLCGR